MSHPAQIVPSFDTAISVDDRRAAEALIVDIDGFEGPLDILLQLSQSQKVDLLKISVLQLARQYIAFVETAKELRIELAADYLLMAAWLAFLKSRLLLPPDPEEEGPSAEDLAEHLAFQLKRLQAMRDCAARLMALDQRGRDFFPRGLKEPTELRRKVVYTASILDLMKGYAQIRTRDEFRPYVMDRDNLVTMETALEGLRERIQSQAGWTAFEACLPPQWRKLGKLYRSGTASTFAASLELVKQGQLEMAQEENFAQLRLRKAEKISPLPQG